MWWHTSCFNSLKALSGWWYHAPLEMTALIRWNDPRSDFFFNDPGKLGMLMEKKKISRPGFFFSGSYGNDRMSGTRPPASP